MRIRAVFGALLFGAVVCSMAAPAGAGAQVAVSDVTPAAGAAIVVTSSGWSPGRRVDISLVKTADVLARTVADARGGVRARVRVPAAAPDDLNVLAVSGTASSGVPQEILTALLVHGTAPTNRPWPAIVLLIGIATALLLASVRTQPLLARFGV
jgi:hypothetical protein